MNQINILRFLERYLIRKRNNLLISFNVPIALLLCSSLLFLQCSDNNDDSDQPTNDFGKITIHFEHKLNNSPLQVDTLMYTNEAGNQYLINEIQYFVSDILLHKDDGSSILIDEWIDIYYVDTDIQNTQFWEVFDKISIGNYDSISFRFGISEEKNISFMYVNPPERDMFWPEYLGGGYHYMKLNGKWLEPNQTVQTTPFDFHLGIGQEYYIYPDSISGFIHNDFTVSLQNSSFTLQKNENKNLILIMNIENWFTDPHIYDHNEYGSHIMQNQEAMEKVKENGYNVFTIQIN